LRDRPRDIPTLVHHFVERYGAELASGAVDVADRTVDRLAAYEWPGNVRELENAIKRALVLATADVLTPESFEFLGSSAQESDGSTLEQRIAQESRAALEESEPRELHRKLLARVEKPLLETVLQHTGGNQLRAASLLGINRNTLRKKLTELEIDVPARG
jgi:DNA-binding NtrC family response regulator